MVIAIDGPSGVGKSTVSRIVADRLGLPHLDTGATYRAATLAALRADVDLGDGAAITDVVRASTIAYEAGEVRLDGDDVSVEIRGPEVTAAVSDIVSTIPEVRDHIVARQREWVASHGGKAVVEGRDIGTVVFPDASVKVFLDARREVRATRRVGDPEGRGKGLAEIAAALDQRDRTDSQRVASPMRRAVDAHLIDTSDLTIDQVVEAVLDLVDQATKS